MDQVTEKRLQNARLYDQLLADLEDDVVIPPRNPEVKQVFHTYVIQVNRREQLMEYLSRHQIETKIHYPIPIHLQAPCRAMGWKPGDLPETEKQAGRILTLPIHQFLTEAQIHHVAATMRRVLSEVDKLVPRLSRPAARISPRQLLIDLLQMMVLIRRFEEKIIEVYGLQDMKSPVHLCIGQEGIAAGCLCPSGARGLYFHDPPRPWALPGQGHGPERALRRILRQGDRLLPG